VPFCWEGRTGHASETVINPPAGSLAYKRKMSTPPTPLHLEIARGCKGLHGPCSRSRVAIASQSQLPTPHCFNIMTTLLSQHVSVGGFSKDFRRRHFASCHIRAWHSQKTWYRRVDASLVHTHSSKSVTVGQINIHRVK